MNLYSLVDILEDAIANVLKDASSYISNFQEECLQIKRKDEIPARKVPKSSEHVKSKQEMAYFS